MCEVKYNPVYLVVYRMVYSGVRLSVTMYLRVYTVQWCEVKGDLYLMVYSGVR